MGASPPDNRRPAASNSNALGSPPVDDSNDSNTMYDSPVGPLPPLEEELVNATFNELFPDGLPTKRRPRVSVAESPFDDVYELEREHLVALSQHATSGASLGVTSTPLKSIRHTHHKLAQLLAIGMDETDAALMCNFSVSRVSILKSDPAFVEILNYYANQVQLAFVDTVDVMKNMTLDLLGELNDRLNDKPEAFTIPQLLDAVKALADRSGHGPTSNVNSNVKSVSLTGADLRALKSDQRAQDGQTREFTEADQRALVRLALSPTGRVGGDDQRAEDIGGERTSGGPPLREEGGDEAPGVATVAPLPSVDTVP